MSLRQPIGRGRWSVPTRPDRFGSGQEPVPRSTVRVLGPGDLQAATALCDRDPVANAFVASRLPSGLLGGGRQAEIWGFYDGPDLVSMCWYGGNLVPVELTDDEAAEAFASRARRLGRRCSSIFGPAGGVMALWRRLAPTWGQARDIRQDQPLMACTRARLAADPFVRPARREDLDLVLPAAIAMFTEEIGYSPVDGDGALLYRAGVAEMVDLGRAFVRIDTGLDGPSVVFKAELGAVTPQVAQIQGVWVAPERRGQGLSEPGVAAVVDAILDGISDVASLYVNAYNTRAIRTYLRVGFETVGHYTTVLF